MPLLLEDLAGDAADALRRTADRFEAAANELAARRLASDYEAIQQEIVDFARHTTDYAIASLPQAEAIWNWGLQRLGKNPFGPEAERLLQSLQTVFTLQSRLCAIAQDMWTQSQSLGFTPERLDELDRIRSQLTRMATEAQNALEHRTKGWQPRDPERFAEAMRRAGEGKFVTAEEARKWFRPSQPPSSEG